VIGKLPPTRVKPVPVAEAEFTVTGDEPDDVSVTDSFAEELTVTLPKLKVVAPSVNCGFAVVPVPLNDTTAVPPVVELLLMVRLPVADPVAVGLNWTCTVIDWLGFNVAGSVAPTMLKAAPEMDAEFTVTGDVPEEVRVTDCVAEELTVTLPKLRVETLSVNFGLVVAEVPVPLNVTVAVLPLVELLLMESFPEAAPAAVGRNFSCKVTDWFGDSVTGTLPATMEKPAPVMEAEVTVTDEVPEDVSLIEPVAVELTATLPKLRAEALSVNFGCRCRLGLAAALVADGPNATQQINARRSAPRRLLSQANVFSGEGRCRDLVGELLVDVDTT
jgi:hypothetical protein